MPYRIVEMDAHPHAVGAGFHGAVEQQGNAKLGDLAVAIRSAQRGGIAA